MQLVNGVGYANIDCHDLSPGKYVVSASFDGDTIFNKDNNSIDFNVKGYPNLSMHVDDSQGMFERLHVVVDADKNFSGNATITLNNRVWTNKIEVVNGHGEGYYDGGDRPGNYTAKASTKECDFFVAGNCSTTYAVKNL
ncbi:hypothetical protein [uncultured Methanobrevibacter sp.]|uniref:hypothetical protein n=1 Tax=uncultured Methanobrevibacter sp. TaxID=253161 RepID=UPI0025DE1571|nr:hypothetical protein [uncultured Methanobrevibacter sp.]